MDRTNTARIACLLGFGFRPFPDTEEILIPKQRDRDYDIEAHLGRSLERFATGSVYCFEMNGTKLVDQSGTTANRDMRHTIY